MPYCFLSGDLHRAFFGPSTRGVRRPEPTVTRKILFIIPTILFIFPQFSIHFHSPVQLIMDRQDQRKRAFSQAFQRMNQPRVDDGHSQATKRTLSYPLSSTTPYPHKSNQENEFMLNLDCGLVLGAIPGTQVRHNPSAELQQPNPRLCIYTSLQCRLNGTGVISPPIVRNRNFEGSLPYEPALPTPQFVQGKSMLSPSPCIRPDFESSSDDTVDAYASCFRSDRVRVIYENGRSSMTDATTTIDPLTPNTLKFGDLSLNSQSYSLRSSPMRDVVHGHRATVKTVPTSSFARYSLYTYHSMQTLIMSQYVLGN